MAFEVVENADGCPAERPWGVHDTDTDEVTGCYADEASAQDAADAAQAEADSSGGDAPPAGAVNERRLFAVLCVEGVETSDGRYLEVGGGTWRNPPLSFMAQTENPEWGGHAGAFLGGRLDTIERMADGRRIYAEGAVDMNSEQGQWLVTQIEAGNLRFCSIDVMAADVEYEVLTVDQEGWPVDVRSRFMTYEIGGVTATPFPALDSAVIWLDGMDAPTELTMELPEPIKPVGTPEVVESAGIGMLLHASAATPTDVEDLPPSEFFDDQMLSALTPLTISEPDAHGWRHIYGHFAAFGECHTGRDGCVTPPRSQSAYRYFRTGETLARCECDGDGDGLPPHVVRVATGGITLGTGHAGGALSASQAAWHYENTGATVADVAAGQDEFGPWISGVVRRDVTDEQLQQLRSSSPSGDWRRLDGALDLVAILSVNYPGFPVPRQPVAHLAASGLPGHVVQTSLVHPIGTPGSDVEVRASAAAPSPRRSNPGLDVVVVPRGEWEALRSAVARIRPVADALRSEAIERLERRVHGDGP